MNNYDFYATFLGHIPLYIGLLVASALVHFFVFRRLIITVLDPYLFPVVFSVISGATVYMLYFTGSVTSYAIASYTLTQLAFFIGLYSFRSNGPWIKREISRIAGDTAVAEDQHQGRARAIVVFYLSMVILVMSQGAIYFLKGIPLFMASRLEMFAQGQGEGVLGRVVDVTVIAALFSFFYVIRFDKVRMSELPKYVCLLIIMTIFFLSGSKSGFLTVVHVLWAYLIFSVINGHGIPKYLAIWYFFKRHLKKMVIASVIIVMLIIAVQTRGMGPDSPGPLFFVGLRFIHSADTFWYAYPYDVYKGIDASKPFQALFTDVLGMLRIYKWADLPQAIGLYLKNLHHPSDIVEGPNARHNIFGLVYFGFAGSIVLSFMLGAVLSFIRNRFVFMVKRDVVSGILFCYLIVRGASIDADPTLFLSYVDNFLFILLPLLAGMSVVYDLLIVKREVADGTT